MTSTSLSFFLCNEIRLENSTIYPSVCVSFNPGNKQRFLPIEHEYIYRYSDGELCSL